MMMGKSALLPVQSSERGARGEGRGAVVRRLRVHADPFAGCSQLLWLVTSWYGFFGSTPNKLSRLEGLVADTARLESADGRFTWGSFAAEPSFTCGFGQRELDCQ